MVAPGTPHQPPQVIAHRGASFEAPENTAAAFDRAILSGATALEIDVHRMKDGTLLVWHDDDVVRTGRFPGGIRSGAVADLVFDEIALCDSGSWFNDAYPQRRCADFVGLRPLTLDDVLTRYGDRVELFIELKHAERYPQMLPKVLEQLDGASVSGHRHRILSTDPLSLLRLHCEDPSVRLVQLLPQRGPTGLAMRDVARYAGAVAPLYTMVGEPLLRAARQARLEVIPYTVNERPTAQALIARGVHGLITDRPDDMLALVHGLAHVPAPAAPAPV
jgi:glycerophosphoryl diester phosphodiesterase